MCVYIQYIYIYSIYRARRAGTRYKDICAWCVYVCMYVCIYKVCVYVYISISMFVLKVHCVIFRMIHRQKCNIIYITMFSEEYKDLT